jgi:hypothetical protein
VTPRIPPLPALAVLAAMTLGACASTADGWGGGYYHPGYHYGGYHPWSGGGHYIAPRPPPSYWAQRRWAEERAWRHHQRRAWERHAWERERRHHAWHPPPAPRREHWSQDRLRRHWEGLLRNQ